MGNLSRVFAPALPTLWPSMLLGRGSAAGFHPFDAPSATFFYFARNAVWNSARMLGLEGREVLVPAYHHGVEVEALVDAGAQPRFYGVGPRCEVDPDEVARRIGPKTRAIYLVHYLGFPGPTEALRALADRHGLALIEDCALALLSCDGDRPLGLTGDAALFCIYKTLPTPHGGVLVTPEVRRFALPEPVAPPGASTASHLLASLLANLELRGGAAGASVRGWLRRVGRALAGRSGVERVATGTAHFDRRHVALGMSALAHRIALAQDARAVVDARRRNFFHLLRRLRDVAPPLFRELPPGVCPLFYPLLVQDKPAVLARLHQDGIEAVDFWSGGHPACDAAAFPDVARLRRTVLEVPCHQDLSTQAMDAVAAVVRAALTQKRESRAWRVRA